VNTELMTMLVGLALTVIAMVSTAIWIVASVRTTTAVLTEQIKQLRYSIEKLYEKHDSSAEAVRNLEHRLTQLEMSTGGGIPRPRTV
jgi:hypothetical protein